jgi:DNA-binding NarL/FixJ family response regulator
MESGDPVLIADEDESSRRLLTAILRNAGYGSLEAADGERALELAREHEPIAAILEIPLSGLSGYELCAALKVEFGASLPVIFLTGSRTESYDRVAGLLLGADDYITKPFAAGELLVRLRNLLHRRSNPEAVRFARRLTRREHEVLGLMAEGLQHQEIARRLFISPKTVGTHVEHILRKLGARSRAQAIAIAYHHHILRPGPGPAALTATASAEEEPGSGVRRARDR